MFFKRMLKNKNSLSMRKQTLENDECKTDIYKLKNEIEIAYIEGPIYTKASYLAIPIS
jgi:hypothetical protein